MTQAAGPVVSVGLPVYNGENFIAHAIESVLAQTFSDFELIICDNASTDETESICRRFAASDPRVRYYRNSENIGSAPNFNLTFDYATGRYFKWLSHDDMMAPDFLELTLAELEAHPDAVLCHSLVRLIDEDHATLDIHDNDLADEVSPRASDRFAALALIPHQCLELDGLIRSETVAATRRLPSYPACDRALLAEIALLGRILKIDKPLSMTREHPERFRRAQSTLEARIAFYDTRNAGRRMVPTWLLYSDYRTMVRRHLTDRGERRRCHWHLLRWWFVNWNAARLAVDLLALVVPGALIRAERFKQRVFSPEPGPDAGAIKGS